MSTEDRLAESERIIAALVKDGFAEEIGTFSACFFCGRHLLDDCDDTSVTHTDNCPYVAAQAWLASKPTEPVMGSLTEALEALRVAGGSGWDDIEDPEAFIRELRGG